MVILQCQRSCSSGDLATWLPPSAWKLGCLLVPVFLASAKVGVDRRVKGLREARTPKGGLAELGVSRASHLTGRRPAEELTTDGDEGQRLRKAQRSSS
jgi:hypothetical protein